MRFIIHLLDLKIVILIKSENDPANCLADAYDIVLNGFELGGGSQRIYEQELQERAFRALGFTQERIDSQFGWFVEAFQYDTPPHGGFACEVWIV